MWQYNDGGRASAGFKGKTGDCVARALAITTGLPYREIYDRLAQGNKAQRVTKHTSKGTAGKRTASHGIYVNRKWFKDLMAELGFVWTPLAAIGVPASSINWHEFTGTLPDTGRMILSLRRHSAAYVDGVLYDTWDSSHDGTAKVFGYWNRMSQAKELK